MSDTRHEVFERCRRAVPSWSDLSIDDFDFDDPKGFSSFTMGVRARTAVDPAAVLYRHLEGKENAILDTATERSTFLLLGEHEIAARCLEYDEAYRIEAFHDGRTLTADDVFDPDVQRGVANELYRLHQLEPVGLPTATFFELLHEQWGDLARSVLVDRRSSFPPDERLLCDELLALRSEETLAKVMRCLPDREPVFCHNDTYHGNVMQLTDGRIKLVDFEFSCRNHIAFDFANFFAETVMVHGLTEPPHFDIAAPRFTDDDLGALIGYYLDNRSFETPSARAAELVALVGETRRALLLSDFMYAMAALPLAVEPIQKIRFIPYAHRRFHKFLAAWDAEFDAI